MRPANHCYNDLNRTLVGIAYMERQPAQIDTEKGRGGGASSRHVGAALLGPVSQQGRSSCWAFRSSVMRAALNRLSTMYYSYQTYVHCEIAFLYQDVTSRTCRAYGVFVEGGVFRKERSFTREGYNWLFMSVEADEHLRMYNFCEKQVGKPFDRQGAFRSTFWPVDSYDRNEGWWCIAFVVSAVQQAGMLKYYNAEAMDVDLFIAILKRHDRRQASMAPLEHAKIASRTHVSPMF